MNIRDNLQSFYVGNKAGSAIYVGDTLIWPKQICDPIDFIDDGFEQTLAWAYSTGEPIPTEFTTCDLPKVKSWYDHPRFTAQRSVFDNNQYSKQIVSAYDLKKFSGVTGLNSATSRGWNYFFRGCSALKEVPTDYFTGGWDHSSAAKGAYSGMFYNCTALERTGDWDVTGGRNFDYMFYGCSSLVEAPNIKFGHNATDSLTHIRLMEMFRGCYNLKSLPLYDAYNWNEWYEFMGTKNDGEYALTDVAGFTNLGQSSMASEYLDLSGCPNLTNTSVQNIINSVASVSTSKGMTLCLAQNVYDEVTDSQKSKLASKGWSLTYY